MKTAIIFVLLLTPIAVAQSVSVTPQGTCRDFTIFVETDLPECWDVKIDEPGFILDEKWKNSFFYAREALCDGTGSVEFRFDNPGNFTATMKLRQNETIIERPFPVDQTCPEPLTGNEMFAIVGLVIVILASAALWHRQH